MSLFLGHIFQEAAAAEFTLPPITFTGFTYDVQIVGLGSVADCVVSFRGSSSIPNTTQGMLMLPNVATGQAEAAPNQPNWHEDAGDAGVADAGNYSVCVTAIDFIDNCDINDFSQPGGSPPVFGQFHSMSTFVRSWTMEGFGIPPFRREGDITLCIAPTADTDDIRASAKIKLIYERVSA